MDQNQKKSVLLTASMYYSAAANRYKIRGYQYKSLLSVPSSDTQSSFFMTAINLGWLDLLLFSSEGYCLSKFSTVLRILFHLVQLPYLRGQQDFLHLGPSIYFFCDNLFKFLAHRGLGFFATIVTIHYMIRAAKYQDTSFFLGCYPNFC